MAMGVHRGGETLGLHLLPGDGVTRERLLMGTTAASLVMLNRYP
jgi:hypothetical protein